MSEQAGNSLVEHKEHRTTENNGGRKLEENEGHNRLDDQHTEHHRVLFLRGRTHRVLDSLKKGGVGVEEDGYIHCLVCFVATIKHDTETAETGDEEKADGQPASPVERLVSVEGVLDKTLLIRVGETHPILEDYPVQLEGRQIPTALHHFVNQRNHLRVLGGVAERHQELISPNQRDGHQEEGGYVPCLKKMMLGRADRDDERRGGDRLPAEEDVSVEEMGTLVEYLDTEETQEKAHRNLTKQWTARGGEAISKGYCQSRQLETSLRNPFLDGLYGKLGRIG